MTVDVDIAARYALNPTVLFLSLAESVEKITTRMVLHAVRYNDEKHLFR